VTWKIKGSRDVGARSGSDCDYARKFSLYNEDGAVAKVTVEFAGPSKGSAGRAERALDRYLDDDRPPPRRLLVRTDGAVFLLEETE